jgi:starch phosphorylase
MGHIGYFTAEIGLRSELHTYSGGLGVLAGDHVKSAADAEIDLIGITLLYREGYGRQHIDQDGNQSESFAAIDPADHLIDTGLELMLPLDGKTIYSRIWKVEVVGITGHIVPVYFLDTHHPQNSDYHSVLGARLYGGDDEVRIRQEYLLGVGGLRLLNLLRIELDGLHLNEGHCTFALLELLNKGWTRNDLEKKVLFTTHTPVPAGHDRFNWDSVKAVLGDMLPEDAKQLVIDAGDPENGEKCSMSHLAVGLVNKVNAVSNLNAIVASGMYGENHIHPITNGVHHITWTSPPMAELYDNQLPNWKGDPTQLAYSGKLSDEDLLAAREKNRSIFRELVKASTGVELHKEKLTVGFARRFATYKRANLVFSDIERLREIAGGEIQFVFSGKAHPRDEGGKQLIRDIYGSAKQIEGEIPVAFLENYDMDTGLAITSGVDIWLNNPIRPLEASGTSGMKAAMNGVPNCSILDGWWPEGCQHGVNGWAIGESEDDRDDERDANNIYSVLEHEVLPAWRQGSTVWANIMRSSIATSARFTGARMITDYLRFYQSFKE